jgi:hypothetical protein
MNSSKRFVTLILAAGVLVLIAAIALGEHMGDRAIFEATDAGSNAPLVTPLPEPTSTGAYGPDWKKTQVLAAASDPRFPDPRIPPKPLPTLPPPPSPKPSPTSSWTPNPNIPIWDQTPPPSGSVSPSPSPAESPTDSGPVVESPPPVMPTP